MAKVNPWNVIKMVADQFDSNLRIASSINDEERRIKDQILGVLNSFNKDDEFQSSQSETLDYGDTGDCHETDENYDAILLDEDDDDEPQASTSHDPNYQESPKMKLEYIPLSEKAKIVGYWMLDGDKKRSLKSVQNRYPRYTPNSVSLLYRWKHQVDEGRDRIKKLKLIGEHVNQMFKSARSRSLIVHDHDLKRWALAKQREIQAPRFRASRPWILKFKQRYNIVSRKITKFVSRSARIDPEQAKVQAREFVNKCKELIPQYGLALTFNADQSGFKYEVHMGRTLETRGATAVPALVQSSNKTTHSYTVMPIISADGRLVGPLFICLQEESGKFPDNAFVHCTTNTFVTCSKSGKMGKEHLESWFKNCYFPSVGPNSLLLLDSWPAHKNNELRQKVTPPHSQVNVMLIPESTTGLCQPCDILLFRSWKAYLRRFEDRILLDNIDISVFQRANVITLQSLIHRQFSAPRFKIFIQRAWIETGYITTEGVPMDQYITPVQFGFTNLSDLCQNLGETCNNEGFVKCAYCELTLCFDHFFMFEHDCA